MKNTSKDYAISVIRLTAFIMIFSCHILQYYGNELAWWLNVGVQIFLLISAFLYGQKEIINPLLFYRKNFVKILVDYYLFLLFVIPMYLHFTDITITTKIWLKLIFGLKALPGLGHLWYISTILFCYLLIPLLFYFTKKRYKYIYFCILICIIQILCSISFLPFAGAWINCFIIGYIFGNIYKKIGKSILIKILSFSLPIAFVFNMTKIYLKYFTSIDNKVINLFYQYAHVFLAIALFFVLVILFQKLSFNLFSKKVLNFTDKIIYDLYLTHHIFILGPFSLFIFEETLLKVVMFSLISGYILFKLSVYIKSKILVEL